MMQVELSTSNCLPAGIPSTYADMERTGYIRQHIPQGHARPGRQRLSRTRRYVAHLMPSFWQA